jgi:GT2 family glycosyltransferase
MTLRTQVCACGNDYSAVEAAFLAETGQTLIDVSFDHSKCASLGNPVSVIIPSFGGQRSLPILLSSLGRQRYRNFEVVVVDDGSEPPLWSTVVRWADLAAPDFPLRVVRCEVNSGYSVARNIGIQCADSETLVMTDDDMRIPDTLTFASALRHAHTRCCVFIGFRENADEARFGAPDACPQRQKDWRWRTKIRPNHMRLSMEAGLSTPAGATVGILEQSRYLKLLGYGQTIALWDLPSLVSSHSISASAADVRAIGGFPEEKWCNRWGFEDLCFAVLMIAAGVFIIPALDWTSMHLIAEGREASRQEQWHTFRATWPRYLQWLDEPARGRHPPRRSIARVGRCGRIEHIRVAMG